jgi:transposase-like protein
MATLSSDRASQSTRTIRFLLRYTQRSHLGYEKGGPAGTGPGNNRNGSNSETVQPDAGTVPVEVSRDRNAGSDSQLIPKDQRRLTGFNELVISLAARAVTVRNTQAHLQGDLRGGGFPRADLQGH